MLRALPTIAFLCTIISFSSFGQFTEVAAAAGLDLGGKKDGGVAWADFNEDGFLDLVVNTDQNDNNHRTRVYFSDGNLPNPTFTDVTFTNANGMSKNECERSVSVADFNNDGYIDICRNANPRFEVYLNRGPSASPAYSFGDLNQDPDFVITGIPGGMNTEGFGWMDYNNDGYLDIIAENHNFGIEIYENPADGSANYFWIDNTTTGLPTGGTTGDYMTLCDYDGDGFVDLMARKQNELDLWHNDGNGTFSVGNIADIQAQNGNKGSVVFCDFDNDGDFDLYWGAANGEEIYEQTGINSGVFVATGEPEASSGVTTSKKVDGCSCGDVDNDGDMDLFMGGDGAGTSYLFKNDGTTNFEFTLDNSGIVITDDTEGTAFADYDNDGDLDLFINIDNDDNQLWRNSLNNTNFLKVRVVRNVGTAAVPILRDDLNSTAVLKDCSNNIIGGIRQVSSVTGHGSNDPAVLHFGLPGGNALEYLVEIRYTAFNGVRSVLDTVVVPNLLADQTITIIAPNGPGILDGCPAAPLPVELAYFAAEKKEDLVHLSWVTASERDNDYFLVERSIDGIEWEVLESIKGAGNSTQEIQYSFDDHSPNFGMNYYRLRQTDFDGSIDYSDIRSIEFISAEGLIIYPNPTRNTARVSGNTAELESLTLYTPAGREVALQEIVISKTEGNLILDLSALRGGVYILRSSQRAYRIQKL